MLNELILITQNLSPIFKMLRDLKLLINYRGKSTNGICISNWTKEKIILQERAIITLPKYY